MGCADFVFDLIGHMRGCLSGRFGVFTPLPNTFVAITEPSARFMDNPSFHAKSSNSPIFEMPSPYMMSNSTCLKGGATLFLTTFTRVCVAHNFVTVLDRADAADIQRTEL
jgi:hypothetical protein